MRASFELVTYDAVGRMKPQSDASDRLLLVVLEVSFVRLPSKISNLSQRHSSVASMEMRRTVSSIA